MLIGFGPLAMSGIDHDEPKPSKTRHEFQARCTSWSRLPFRDFKGRPDDVVIRLQIGAGRSGDAHRGYRVCGLRTLEPSDKIIGRSGSTANPDSIARRVGNQAERIYFTTGIP